MTDFSKDSAEFKMFADYYNLTKRWYDGVKESSEMKIFTDEVNEFTQKYKSGKCGLLATKLGSALINYVDSLYYAYKDTGVHQTVKVSNKQIEGLEKANKRERKGK